MYRGTTPTLTFGLPFDPALLAVVFVTISQGGEVVLEKELTDCTIEGQNLSLRLTQADTLLLDAVKDVEIQIRGRFADGSAIASDIMQETADRILKDGVI